MLSIGVRLWLVFLGFWAVALFSSVETLVDLLLGNSAVQVAFFALVACIPFLRTGRMSYVDLAWPFGVALIGLQILLFGDGARVRVWSVGGVYLFIGLRMGIGAIYLAMTTGVIVKTELPRYRYRRMVLEDAGGHVRGHMLAEIMAQALANMSVLALPGFLMAINPSPELSAWEIAGALLWGTAYVFESVADAQKLVFISRDAGGVCRVGLWRYSRHPNYFAEWLVWTSLVVAAVPSWLALAGVEAPLVWIALGVGSVGASAALYTTLIYITGAVPAEYFSARKRPGYKAYQATTNRFFPWFPSKAQDERP